MSPFLTSTLSPVKGSVTSRCNPGRTSSHRAALPSLSPWLQQRNQRLEQYRDLVRPIAWHYAHRSPESAEDLQQVGLMGLLRASELFDETQGTPFTAFARPHIRGAILHYLRDQARPVRLPRRHQELEDRLRGVRRELEVRLGRLATETELRQALGLSEEQWHRFQAAQRLSRPASLTEHEGQDIAAAACEDIPDPLAAGVLLAELSRLNPIQQQVIRHVVLEGWSLRRTASILQISPMTVSRQLRRGLDDLRRALSGCGGEAQFAC